MIIGVCLVDIIMHENKSLKEKRHIIKSIKKKIQVKFNVSIAEVDDLDKLQRSKIGFSLVSNSIKHNDEVIDSVIAYLEFDGRFDFKVIDRYVV